MFSDRLKEVRRANGLTLERLALLINERFGTGITKGTLSKYENGKQQPMADTAGCIAAVLGVSTDYLFGTDVPERSKNGVWVPVYGRVAAGLPIERRRIFSITRRYRRHGAHGGVFRT